MPAHESRALRGMIDYAEENGTRTRAVPFVSAVAYSRTSPADSAQGV